MLQKVNLLDSQTYNRIAAGEVVQRPASVVKELVENSLDAQASEVVVEIEGAGKKLIRITDDGEGMSPADVRVAFLKHATSKIVGTDDLDAIATLGFRGEALSSIAAVSLIELVTKPNPELYKGSDVATGEELEGTRCVIQEGKLASTESWGGAVGTTIKVNDLFLNTPARKKFLKSDATELANITQVIRSYAISNPDVRFKLIVDGNNTLTTAGSGIARDALAQVWGVETARDLIEVDWGGEDEQFAVQGFISAPGVYVKNSRKQLVTVNERPVQSKEVREAVYDAVRTSTMVHAHPVFVLDVLCAPASVDVNVHPAKSEVRFRNPTSLRSAVKDAIAEAVRTSSVTIDLEDGHGTEHTAMQSTFVEEAVAPSTGAKLADVDALDMEYYPPALFQTSLFSDEEPSEVVSEYVGIGNQHGLPPLRPIGQIDLTYIICESHQGMVIVDQHALAERVELERIEKEVEADKGAGQELIDPVVMTLSKTQIAALEEMMEMLSEMGFAIEPFGTSEMIVRKVPTAVGVTLTHEELETMVEEFIQSSKVSDIADRRLRVLQTMACKRAVRAGEVLDAPGMRKIVAGLFELDNPFVCAHGRPTHLVMTSQELEKKFKRVV